MVDLIGGIILWAIALSYSLICAKSADKAERKFRRGVEGWE